MTDPLKRTLPATPTRRHLDVTMSETLYDAIALLAERKSLAPSTWARMVLHEAVQEAKDAAARRQSKQP